MPLSHQDITAVRLNCNHVNEVDPIHEQKSDNPIPPDPAHNCHPFNPPCKLIHPTHLTSDVPEYRVQLCPAKMPAICVRPTWNLRDDNFGVFSVIMLGPKLKYLRVLSLGLPTTNLLLLVIKTTSFPRLEKTSQVH